MTLNEEFEQLVKKYNYCFCAIIDEGYIFVSMPTNSLARRNEHILKNKVILRMTNTISCDNLNNILIVYLKNEEGKKETIADKVIGSTHVRSKLNNQIRPIAGIKDNLVLTGEGCWPVEQCVFLKKVDYNAKLSIDTAQRGLQSGNINIYENGKLHSKILIISCDDIITKDTEGEYLVMNDNDFKSGKYTMLFHRFEQIWPVPF